MAVELRPVDAEAFAELCDGLRPADMRELHAAQGRPVVDVIADSIAQTVEPLAAWTTDDRLVAIFGIVPLGPILTPLAAPWLLGTRLLDNHAGDLVRLSRRYVSVWRETYPLLVNFVDARNTASVRYLQAVGFTLDDPLPFGSAGLPFHRFHMGLSTDV